jgi:hypothetical protein
MENSSWFSTWGPSVNNSTESKPSLAASLTHLSKLPHSTQGPPFKEGTREIVIHDFIYQVTIDFYV